MEARTGARLLCPRKPPAPHCLTSPTARVWKRLPYASRSVYFLSARRVLQATALLTTSAHAILDDPVVAEHTGRIVQARTPRPPTSFIVSECRISLKSARAHACACASPLRRLRRRSGAQEILGDPRIRKETANALWAVAPLHDLDIKIKSLKLFIRKKAFYP